jgi:hypothetical protein
MRIRERLSNGTPYKWTLENFEDGKWVNENTCGVFFWDRFGKKTEKLYSNEVLPARVPMKQEGRSRLTEQCDIIEKEDAHE